MGGRCSGAMATGISINFDWSQNAEGVYVFSGLFILTADGFYTNLIFSSMAYTCLLAGPYTRR